MKKISEEALKGLIVLSNGDMVVLEYLLDNYFARDKPKKKSKKKAVVKFEQPCAPISNSGGRD